MAIFSSVLISFPALLADGVLADGVIDDKYSSPTVSVLFKCR